MCSSENYNDVTFLAELSAEKSCKNANDSYKNEISETEKPGIQSKKKSIGS